MKSKFKKLLATALVLCLVLALLPAAAFAAGPYTVSFVNKDGNVPFNGTITVNNVVLKKGEAESTQIEAGTEVTVTANPNEDYQLFSISADNAKMNPSSGSYTFTMPENDVKITVQFMPYYSIEAASDMTGGNVIYPETAMYTETVTITATPNEGYKFVEFNVSGKGTNDTIPTTITGENTATFQMPDHAVIVSAGFEAKETFAITTATSELGYVTAPASAYAGQVVSVSATATASGASVESIKITKTSDGEEYKTITGASGTFDMPAFPVTVKAVFGTITPPVTDTYTIITADKITGGDIWSTVSSAKAGETVYIKVDPDWGWMTDDVYYKTTPDAGLIAGNASFTGYAANGDEIWTFTMPAGDVWVYAEFEPYFPGHDYHAITVTSDGHCDVSVPTWAYCGDNVTINLSNFDTGYAFSYLKVNGEYVTPYGFNGYLSYTFTMPHNNVAIEVGTTSVSGKYYIATSYDSTLGGVEVWVNNNYVNNWHQGSWADYKDSVSFKVKPYYSDDVVSVSVVGKRTGWTYSYDYNSYSGWYTFTMPNEDVTINVDFRSGVHKVYVDKVTDGKLTVSDDWAKFGQIVYITAVPDYGCTLSSLSVRTATGDSVRVYNAQKADTYYFYMPDQYVSVSAVFTGKYTSLPFNDVSYGDWYYDAVQFVYSKGIMDGVDYYKFAPNGTITRGMIVTMLWRMAGEPFEMPVTSFTDVEIGRYYTTAVAWACRNGIADGMGESTFGPNDAITREELVTLLYRYAQYFGHSCIGTSIEGFADAGSVSSYAYNAMCWAYKAGVVTGTTGSRLNPQGTASRAEAAQMIMSFYSFLNS